MGYDVTLYHPQGAPLGTVAAVKQALTAVFPGIKFNLRPSGAEKLQAAVDMGVELPEEIREELAARPALLCGEYQTAAFSVQFLFQPEDPVTQIDLHHHGLAAESAPLFAQLQAQTGWETATV